MKGIRRLLVPAAVIAISITAAAVVRADDTGQDDQANRYKMNVLVSDIPIKNMNPTIDPVLQNSWGVAFSPAGSPFWIADNATGCATLYAGDGTKVLLQGAVGVSIPLPGDVVHTTSCKTVDPNNPPMNAAPTGIIWNPSSAFIVPGTKSTTNPNGIQASFIFATEDGTLSAWAQGLTPNPTNAVIAFDNSASGAVYKGLASGVNVNGFFLFATNFNAGTVDVFGPNGPDGLLFTPATTSGGFIDPDIPAGYAPFGIESIDGNLFVSYALQDAAKHDDVKGPGHGFIDVFDTDGHLVRRFASRGPLNSPWGMTRASFAFGRFSGDILVGNFGNGKINVFNSRGLFLDELDRPNGKPLVIDGLWKLTLGGGRTSSPDTLYFTAGPNDEKDGRFGTITPLSSSNNN
jgi:uncharacterized protein (TIGR03118 family)